MGDRGWTDWEVWNEGGGGRMGEIGCEVRGRGMGEGEWKAGAGRIREDECRLGCEGVGEFG